jgi:hypothetical protein
MPTKEIDEYRAMLSEAAYLFENIKQARELPPTAQARQQYEATGREIRDLLKKYEEA